MTTLAETQPQPVAGARRRALRTPLFVFAAGYLLLMALAAIAAPLLAPYDPVATDLDHVLSGPSLIHPLGTDQLGHDVLSRVIYGGRVTLSGVAEAVLTALVLGVTTGLLAGFAGGWVDRVLSWITDIVLAIPVIVTLLVVLAVVGSNETAAMIAVGVLGFPSLARVVRGATLTVRQELYITAARAFGLPDRTIMVRHVLPRVSAPIIVQTSLFAGGALLAETGLGYLGLGVQAPTPAWGNLVADASTVIAQQPWLLVPSGLVIGLAVLSFGLLGDAGRDTAADRRARSAQGRTRAAVREPAPRPDSTALLAVRDLTVGLPGQDGFTTAVDRLSIDLHPGETVGLVGESGCGKSLTGRGILDLLPAGARILGGGVWFDGTDLSALDGKGWQEFRGSRIALIAQDPMNGLDPTAPVGKQVDELVRRHTGRTGRAVRARTLELLADVRLPEPETVAAKYPHQLSGGMAQRVLIASALAGSPELLIADEPTTALDVTVQAEILRLLKDVQRANGMAVLLISHDLGVIAEVCDRAYVMYAGQIAESGAVAELFESPRHPYTAGLLGALPRRGTPRQPLTTIPGTVPEPGNWPPGCHFRQRCPLATAECAAVVPVAEPVPGHRTRCIHHDLAPASGGDHDRAEITA
ncbi:dipeptide/oligopeptide/nickel ABC transporter permease/ATP-binding protein [Amycolatopsis rubida]|uniref:Dipeptide/oligopeptide/nickel ABC transporter permease/ATP-binding protein n=1 Tax=Amycolatopsis rubida TaxID=112413 RepID=A0ABX0BP13_9PSEU|nr:MULTISPECIES: dipeptide/oligopeptide/nickel ABC transporter permease/ATP-binding protein [Amycolatopsis]MYW91694.1 ATP-binding cassette domain-containing protein [Amycolatopsis rubida]NEC56678.1 dipeptide/oligopeptide/nickel ABC transporter permease/ATP-binding protein [Amycolatopsis rubida]OAP20431.1 putative D,D-dipeptide transport ATP-binding protein DdpD [Amycolatopsis sp. M39]